MKFILKPIFEIFTNQITVFDNPIIEYLIKALIGLIAYKGAWNIVHELYGDSIITSKNSGSIIHWTVRAIIFYILCVIIGITTGIINWCITNWQIILIIGILSITFFMLYLKRHKRRNDNE